MRFMRQETNKLTIPAILSEGKFHAKDKGTVIRRRQEIVFAPPRLKGRAITGSVPRGATEESINDHSAPAAGYLLEVRHDG